MCLQNSKVQNPLMLVLSTPKPQPFLPRDIWGLLEHHYEGNYLRIDVLGKRLQCRSSTIEDFLRTAFNDLIAAASSWVDLTCKFNEGSISQSLKRLNTMQDCNRSKNASIDDYVIKRRIGSGGFGVVHLSSNTQSGEVAIKVDPQKASVIWEAEVHRMVI